MILRRGIDSSKAGSEVDAPTALSVELYRPDGTWVEVGFLCRNDERNWFEIDDAYWELVDRPILGQVFEEHGPGWRPTTRTRLPNWFGHTLPEGRLRRAVADAAHVNIEREFHLLASIGGEDLPGGLRVRPADRPIDDLHAELGSEATDAGSTVDPRLKFSLAGVQLKFSSRALGKGFAIPGSGDAVDWILKLPGGTGYERVTDLEAAILTLARAVGIPVPNHGLVPIAEVEGLPEWATGAPGNVLAVERFDRLAGGGRVHFEELAQVLDIPTASDDAKYARGNLETVVRATLALAGSADAFDAVRRIVFAVLVGNGDAHLKNWAFTYPDGRRARLSPAYDLVPTRLFLPNDDLGLKLAGSRRFEDVTLESFRRLGERLGLGGDLVVGLVEAVVGSVVDAWPLLGDLVTPDELRRLTEHRDALPLLRNR
jgi:serine/threonine-protein kinase HipA